MIFLVKRDQVMQAHASLINAPDAKAYLLEGEQYRTEDQDERPENRSAFPVMNGQTRFASGLSKREYFAGLAMQSFCVSEDMARVSAELNKDFQELVAMYSVAYADALIKELSK